jgi:hypothetical protein
LLPPCSGSAPENKEKGNFKCSVAEPETDKAVIKLPPGAGVVITAYSSGSGSLLKEKVMVASILVRKYTRSQKRNFQGF